MTKQGVASVVCQTRLGCFFLVTLALLVDGEIPRGAVEGTMISSSAGLNVRRGATGSSQTLNGAGSSPSRRSNSFETSNAPSVLASTYVAASAGAAFVVGCSGGPRASWGGGSYLSGQDSFGSQLQLRR